MRTMTTKKNLLRCLASSSLNPYCIFKSVSVRNGCLEAVSAHFFSTATAIAEKSSPSHPVQQDTLFRRLMAAANPKKPTDKEPISLVLKQWVNEGRELDPIDVRSSIKQLRKLKRYSPALEISEWICSSIDKSYSTIGSAAIHLDLIYKVHGLEEAKRYFENTPDDSKVPHLYGALLNCYVEEKLLDEAEAIMQKMRELGYDGNLSYNGMLKLYSQMGEPIKMKALMQEMESKDIRFDKFTYNILLSAYACTGDIMEMEKLLMNMEADPLGIDWMSYSISANGYLKAGDIAKATGMLKKCEVIIKDGEQRGPKPRDLDHAYEVIITQYATLGRKDEVYRIWKLHKKPRKVLNRSYTCMISSLLKLDDTAGAQKVLDDWLSRKVVFDVRIPNLLVSAFCKKGQIEQAELIVHNLVERGEQPAASTWHHMASGYCKSNRMEDAVKMTKKGLRKNPGWRPDIPVLASCFEYLKQNGDNAEVEEILGLMEDGGKFPADFRDLILRYMRNGDPSEPVQMKMDSDSEEEHILGSTGLKLENESS